EQLYRLNVGVAVHHATCHDRAGICLFLGHLAQARNVEAQQAYIADEPEDERNSEPQIGGSHDEHDAREVDHHIIQHVDELHDELAHSERRLHQLGGDASCEFVLIEGHRLLEQVTVHVPADAHWIV